MPRVRAMPWLVEQREVTGIACPYDGASFGDVRLTWALMIGMGKGISFVVVDILARGW